MFTTPTSPPIKRPQTAPSMFRLKVRKFVLALKHTHATLVAASCHLDMYVLARDNAVGQDQCKNAQVDIKIL